tara:strand:+ start:81 stop:224 length:144 start_codon:yes stop_codon:yes gene_type:complete
VRKKKMEGGGGVMKADVANIANILRHGSVAFGLLRVDVAIDIGEVRG